MIARTASLLVAWALLGAVQSPPPIEAVTVDPLTIDDDDFSRHRDPATWQGLSVTRIEFREERGNWRLFRIANGGRPRGPLWFVPHDNENAAFEAALVSVRKHGGVAIIVDSGVAEDGDGRRRNTAVEFGRPIDPNRNFRDGNPNYAATILADYRRGARPIIALHTNAPGFDPANSRCNQGDPVGRGEVSIRFCDDVMQPSPRNRAPGRSTTTILSPMLRTASALRPSPPIAAARLRSPTSTSCSSRWRRAMARCRTTRCSTASTM